MEKLPDPVERFQLTDMLIKFIFQIDTTPADGTTMLNLLAEEWSINADHYRKATKGMYDTMDAAFS